MLSFYFAHIIENIYYLEINFTLLQVLKQNIYDLKIFLSIEYDYSDESYYFPFSYLFFKTLLDSINLSDINNIF